MTHTSATLYEGRVSTALRPHLQQMVVKVCLARLLFLILLLLPIGLAWIGKEAHTDTFRFFLDPKYTAFLVFGFGMTAFFLFTWSLFNNILFFFRLQLGADLLLVVIDASSPWNRQQLKTVDDVLRELHAEHIPRLRIMNKVDLITDAFQRKQLQLAFPEAIFVSAHEPESLAPLKDAIGRGVAESRKGRAMDDVIARKSRELQRRQEHTETGWRP